MSTQIPTDSGRGYPNKSTGNISSLASLHSLKTTMPGAFVDAVRRQRNTSFELHSTNSVSTGVMSGYVGYLSGIISGLGRAIEYMGQVMSLVNATEDLHSVAKTTLGVLMEVFELVKEQTQRDANIEELALSMQDMLSSLAAMRNSAKMPLPLDAVEHAIDSATKCTEYIYNHLNDGLWGRFIHQTALFEEFQNDFNKLQGKLNYGVGIRYLETTWEVESRILTNSEKALLNRMPHAENAHDSDNPRCLDGTRQNILQAILQWIDCMETGRNVLWLHGVAGSGKTTIASTVAAMSEHDKDTPGRLRLWTLGSAFFCRQDNWRLNRLALIWPTIARRLAHTFPLFRGYILELLRTSPDIGTSSFTDQFRKLIIEPLSFIAQRKHYMPPILIIIDALDDCGNSSSRASALHGFIEASINLPSWVKILVTSRPEPDISESFSSVFDTCQLDTSNEEQRADVAVYIKYRIEALRQRKSLGNHWPGTEKTEDLITRADGLFISARLSLDLIEKQHRALDLILLEDDLSAGDRGQSEIRLDQLYCKILYRCQLSTNNPCHFPPRRPLIHSILELVIFAKVPISASHLFDLTCNDIIDDVNAVERVIDELAPVLQLDASSTIRVIHSSFVDFLTSPGRSQELCIATSKWHRLRFALTSLRVLNHDLQYDLCQIGDLSLLNAEVPDIEGKLRRESSLFHCGQFWIEYIMDCDELDGEVFRELVIFFTSRLLEWCELLSLSHCLEDGLHGLDRLHFWFRKNIPYSASSAAIVKHIRDAAQFIHEVHNEIVDRALYVYIYPLMDIPPRKATFARQYGPQALCSLLLSGNMCSRFVPIPISTAMSPNGDYLALGSQSGTITVYSVTERAEKWATDVHTRKAIRSLKFSPKDGARLVSASDDWSIRVWNVETGSLVALLEGHCGAVRSVAFSPDGHYIASTSDDTSLRIWDTEKYTELFCFRDEEQGVSAVTFSPDGRYIATGCEDGFVRILEWHSDINVATELRLLDTLSCGASFAPNSLAFLPGGPRGWPWRIAVIRNLATVWDVFTREVVAQSSPWTKKNDSHTFIIGDDWAWAEYEECRPTLRLLPGMRPFEYCLKSRRLAGRPGKPNCRYDEKWTYIPFTAK